MSIKIRSNDCKFFVNKEKRKVICVFEHAGPLLDRFLRKDEQLEPLYFWLTTELDIELPKRFVGIATCSEEDEWDEERGKTIAFHRMKNSLFNTFFRKANAAIGKVDNTITYAVEKFNTFGEKVAANMEKEEKEINSYFE